MYIQYTCNMNIKFCMPMKYNLIALLYSSPEQKARMSFSDQNLSSLALSLVLFSLSSQTFHINIFFSRTTGPISIKLGTMFPWVKGIQVCSNEVPRPFPRGDNYKMAKIHWQQVSDVAHRPLVIWLGGKSLYNVGTGRFWGVDSKLFMYIKQNWCVKICSLSWIYNKTINNSYILIYRLMIIPHAVPKLPFNWFPSLIGFDKN